MKRTLAISLLTLLLALPAWGDMIEVPPGERPLHWFAREADLNALNGKVVQVESTLTQRIAEAESAFTQRIAQMERTLAQMERALTEKVANLKQDLQDLRARAESSDRAAGTKPNGEPRTKLNGEQGVRKPSSLNGRGGGDRLSAVTQRVTEIEKSLTEMVAKLQEVRAQLHDLRARAEHKDRQAQATR